MIRGALQRAASQVRVAKLMAHKNEIKKMGLSCGNISISCNAF